MWERIGEIANGYALYRRITLHEEMPHTIFICTDKGRPADGQFGGYPKASTALAQKGL